MPNTSNQALPYPSPTDPVDVPGDIQALAEVIDTKMLDKAVINAKGDLIVGTADNTIARLGVGANNTLAVADSAEATGIKWAFLAEASIAAGAVTATKIADGAVSTIKIADGAVTSEKLAAGAAVPAGVINPYAGVNAPTGWLLCNGADVSRTIYSALFSSFGTTFTTANTTSGSTTVSGLSGMTSSMIGWGIAGTNIPSGATIVTVSSTTQVTISSTATGTASGTANIAISPYGFTGAGNTTTFLLPDLRNRFIAGQGTNSWSDVLNEKGGSTDAIVVAHTHTGPSHSHDMGHGHSGSASGGTHNHSGRFLVTATGSGSNAHLARPTGYSFDDILQNTEENTGSHSHTLSINNFSGSTGTGGTGSTGSTGSVATNANLPPYLTLSHIIKT